MSSLLVFSLHMRKSPAISFKGQNLNDIFTALLFSQHQHRSQTLIVWSFKVSLLYNREGSVVLSPKKLLASRERIHHVDLLSTIKIDIDTGDHISQCDRIPGPVSLTRLSATNMEKGN